MQTEPERLGEHLRLVQDQRNVLVVSAASSWEIAVKYQLGKLQLPESPERYVPPRIRAIGAEAAAIEHPHALAASSLPKLHRDPFNRLLVAQTTLLGLTILTADRAVDRRSNDSGKIPSLRSRVELRPSGSLEAETRERAARVRFTDGFGRELEDRNAGS